MTMRECYEAIGGNYEAVLGRLHSEALIRRFALKFLEDQSYIQFWAAWSCLLFSGSVSPPAVMRRGTFSFTRRHSGENLNLALWHWSRRRLSLSCSYVKSTRSCPWGFPRCAPVWSRSSARARRSRASSVLLTTAIRPRLRKLFWKQS